MPIFDKMMKKRVKRRKSGNGNGRKTEKKNNTLQRKKYISFLLPFTIYDIPFSRKTLLLLLLLFFSFHRQSEFSLPLLSFHLSNCGIYFFPFMLFQKSCHTHIYLVEWMRKKITGTFFSCPRSWRPKQKRQYENLIR